MVENLGFKPRQSASRSVFLTPPLCCLNNSRPRNRTQLFWPYTNFSGPVPCRHFHYSFIMKRPLQLGSSPLVLTPVTALTIKGLNQRLVFTFRHAHSISCFSYFIVCYLNSCCATQILLVYM